MKWWQIRLLKLSPGSFHVDDQIEAELHVEDVVHSESGGVVLHNVQEYVEYGALSKNPSHRRLGSRASEPNALVPLQRTFRTGFNSAFARAEPSCIKLLWTST